MLVLSSPPTCLWLLYVITWKVLMANYAKPFYEPFNAIPCSPRCVRSLLCFLPLGVLIVGCVWITALDRTGRTLDEERHELWKRLSRGVELGFTAGNAAFQKEDGTLDYLEARQVLAGMWCNGCALFLSLDRLTDWDVFVSPLHTSVAYGLSHGSRLLWIEHYVCQCL